MPKDYAELADVIERFLCGTSRGIEWDVYTLGKTYKDPFLDTVQRRMISVSADFPPASNREYTNAEGLRVLRSLADELRARSAHLKEDC